MENPSEPAAPSTEELAELEAEFARLERELVALDEPDDPGEASPGATAAGGAG